MGKILPADSMMENINNRNVYLIYKKCRCISVEVLIGFDLYRKEALCIMYNLIIIYYNVSMVV